ncbi:branched-chain amino acid ABC transporter permease [Pseudomonas putida]|uniref:Amino acid/amide ABC transporter membrane protein 2, HAAT family n=4 Tax=Pseudomonas TaxID=286 RepID=A0ABY0VRV5_9PSED|nr:MULTISPECIES: branched-chain amino acid ABC transporter permease [Pseudomonas]SEC18656.1 amino acid/amide ABC transporter membrane protein 2, HAAT family [Pseudomonas marginalis]KRP72574.1 ABC transporter permease [Pseudomonas veronii]MCF4972788.1 branched-chain amino acid ABC transporter permease [Pseudomonas lactis]MCF5001580.1 branched-chain amino acid ABC transporter permease [Pseudomonas lactis]MCF5007959.1 branched-chain amino acid ABC transporter permease [Pseudomonas lactis]
MRLDKTELILLAVAALLAAGGWIAPQWLVFLLTMALAKAMVVQGVVMQMRAGLVTFGQGLFFCVGGYAVGMSGHFLNISDLALLLVIGVGAAVLLAMILGLLMTRYREIFFAMLSLAFSMILYGVLVKSSALGSTDGFNVKAWTLFGWSPASGQGPLALFMIIIACSAVLAVLLHRYSRSSAGMMCEAIRENEVRVEYLGQSPRWVLYMNYVAAAAVSALGGGFMALSAGHIDPEMAYWITSGEFVFIALLGGTAHVAAPFIAAIVFAVVRTYAIELVPHSWQMILGFTLLAIIVFLPKGLWSLFTGNARRAKA